MPHCYFYHRLRADAALAEDLTQERFLAAPHGVRASETATAAMIEPEAGGWKTWVITGTRL